MLQRQASAGSLPPDHHHHHQDQQGQKDQHHHHHHHHHHMHQGQQGQKDQQGCDDGGYKSDGEAYSASHHASGNPMCYKNSNSDAGHVHATGTPAGEGRVRHHTGGHACQNHPAGQRPIRSLSGQLVTMSGQDHNHHIQSGRNGYLSDGEGYMIQNQRVSRSGKYGSQASSPRSDRHLALHHDDAMSDDDEEEEESDDDEEEEEDDHEDLEHDQELEDNIEAEIHMNDMKADHLPGPAGVAGGPGQVQQRDQQQQATSSSVMSKQQQGPSASDLIVSYSAFQAEATAAVPGGRSGMLLFQIYTIDISKY